MSEGASYGASEGTAQGKDQGTTATQTEESQVTGQPIPAPTGTEPAPTETGAEGTAKAGPPEIDANVHEESSKAKGLAYKRVMTTIFCFDCGRKAEYFAVNFGKWEKYLCTNDMEKEKKTATLARTPVVPIQATQLKDLMQQSQQEPPAETPPPQEETPPPSK